MKKCFVYDNHSKAFFQNKKANHGRHIECRIHSHASIPPSYS